MDIPVHVRYLQIQLMPGIYSSITVYRSAHRILYYDGTGKAGGGFVSLDALKRAWKASRIRIPRKTTTQRCINCWKSGIHLSLPIF